MAISHNETSTSCTASGTSLATRRSQTRSSIESAQRPYPRSWDDGTGFDRDECGCAYREPEDQRLGDRSFAWTKADVTAGEQGLPAVTAERDPIRCRRHARAAGAWQAAEDQRVPVRRSSAFKLPAPGSVVGRGHHRVRTHAQAVHEARRRRALRERRLVGKPKDVDWRACYAILQPDAPEPVQFVRVDYDLATVTKAIRESELPDIFAADLETGGIRAARTGQ